MNVLITMAGDGKRFIDAGYTKTIKPLIEVNGKTILEWTLDSIPDLSTKHKLNFAIRTEHVGVEDWLKNTFGESVGIKTFETLTRGNLETAYQSCQDLFGNCLDSELLILDSDNHYDGSKLLEHLRYLKQYKQAGAICCFEPVDDDNKWCFAKLREDETVMSLHEKVFVQDSYPMVGVFYFSSTRLFVNLAREIIESNKMVKNEFFMSQAINKLLEKRIPVYGLMVDKVVPLGTPEDLEKFIR